MELKSEVAEIVRHWLRRADNHMVAARILAQANDIRACDAACYHVHEAIAKYIHALLTMHGTHAARTHDLEYLFYTLPPEHQHLLDCSGLAFLSTYGIERYWDPDLDQVASALDIGTRFQERVHQVAEPASVIR